MQKVGAAVTRGAGSFHHRDTESAEFGVNFVAYSLGVLRVSAVKPNLSPIAAISSSIKYYAARSIADQSGEE
jgi:hypothetical protein